MNGTGIQSLRGLRRLAAAVVFGALVLWPAAGRAQAPVAIDRLLIEMRPEYDQPAVLVIYWITLAADTDLPASVSVRIPAAVGEPYAVGAGQGESGVPLLATYDRRVDGEWATITIEADSLSVQVEFYADLTIQGDERQFLLTWPGGAALGALDYFIQHPVDSSDMRIIPAPDSQAPGADGLTYSRAELGPQTESATTTIRLSYTKSTPTLTVDVLQPAAPLEATGPTEGIVLQDWLPWALGGLGAVLLGAVAVWYWRSSRRAAPRPRSRRPRPASREAGPAEAEIDASAIYCHHCGAKAGVSDHFCRRCGTRLRQ